MLSKSHDTKVCNRGCKFGKCRRSWKSHVQIFKPCGLNTARMQIRCLLAPSSSSSKVHGCKWVWKTRLTLLHAENHKITKAPPGRLGPHNICFQGKSINGNKLLSQDGLPLYHPFCNNWQDSKSKFVKSSKCRYSCLDYGKSMHTKRAKVERVQYFATFVHWPLPTKARILCLDSL